MAEEREELTEQEQEEQLEREIQQEEEEKKQQEQQEEVVEESEEPSAEEPKEEVQEQPKKKKKRLEHVNDFISSAQPLYNLSNMQVSGFKAFMAGREYQYDVEVFKQELKRYLGK